MTSLDHVHAERNVATQHRPVAERHGLDSAERMMNRESYLGWGARRDEKDCAASSSPHRSTRFG